MTLRPEPSPQELAIFKHHLESEDHGEHSQLRNPTGARVSLALLSVRPWLGALCIFGLEAVALPIARWLKAFNMRLLVEHATHMIR